MQLRYVDFEALKLWLCRSRLLLPFVGSPTQFSRHPHERGRVLVEVAVGLDQAVEDVVGRRRGWVPLLVILVGKPGRAAAGEGGGHHPARGHQQAGTHQTQVVQADPAEVIHVLWGPAAGGGRSHREVDPPLLLCLKGKTVSSVSYFLSFFLAYYRVFFSARNCVFVVRTPTGSFINKNPFLQRQLRHQAIFFFTFFHYNYTSFFLLLVYLEDLRLSPDLVSLTGWVYIYTLVYIYCHAACSSYSSGVVYFSSSSLPQLLYHTPLPLLVFISTGPKKVWSPS